MKEINFVSAKQMVEFLMINEGVILHDHYGRRWQYSDFVFRYSDIGEKFLEDDRIECLHLYGEGFKYIAS